MKLDNSKKKILVMFSTASIFLDLRFHFCTIFTFRKCIREILKKSRFNLHEYVRLINFSMVVRCNKILRKKINIVKRKNRIYETRNEQKENKR